MITFPELFNVILGADKDQSRKAARAVRKLVYSSGEDGRHETITAIIESAPIEYRKIEENFRQENFVTVVSVVPNESRSGNREEY